MGLVSFGHWRFFVTMWTALIIQIMSQTSDDSIFEYYVSVKHETLIWKKPGKLSFHYFVKAVIKVYRWKILRQKFLGAST